MLELKQEFRQLGDSKPKTADGSGDIVWNGTTATADFDEQLTVPAGVVLVPTSAQVDLLKNAAGGEYAEIHLEDADGKRYWSFIADTVGSQGQGLEGNGRHAPVGRAIGPFDEAKVLTLKAANVTPVTTQKVAALVTLHQVVTDGAETFADLDA